MLDNSGVWLDYRVQSTENQKIVWLPFNDKTKTIFYDQRFIISQDRETPVAWSCSKVEDMNVKGIARYTLKQDKFDEHNDYIEKDADGNVIGMWASYFDNKIVPTDSTTPSPTIHSEIKYSGIKPEVKIGGSFKKFTVNFFKDDEPDKFRSGNWKFNIDGIDVSSLFEIKYYGDASDIDVNQCKIKFLGTNDYIGKILVVSYESIDGITSSVEMNMLRV